MKGLFILQKLLEVVIFMEEKNIPTVYDPQSFEKKWYKFWEEKNLFHAEVERDKKPFSIVIPPPNVTGQLHMGHALDNTLQDIQHFQVLM